MPTPEFTNGSTRISNNDELEHIAETHPVGCLRYIIKNNGNYKLLKSPEGKREKGEEERSREEREGGEEQY